MWYVVSAFSVLLQFLSVVSWILTDEIWRMMGMGWGTRGEGRKWHVAATHIFFHNLWCTTLCRHKWYDVIRLRQIKSIGWTLRLRWGTGRGESGRWQCRLFSLCRDKWFDLVKAAQLNVNLWVLWYTLCCKDYTVKCGCTFKSLFLVIWCTLCSDQWYDMIKLHNWKRKVIGGSVLNLFHAGRMSS